MSNIITNRKIAWPVGIVLTALYFSPSILHFLTPAPHPGHGITAQNPQTKPPAGIPAPPIAPVGPGIVASIPAVPTAPVVAVAAGEPSLGTFLGVWQGGVVIPKRGTCVLKLDVRDSHDKEHPLEGYSTLGCMPSMLDLMARNHAKKQSPVGAIDSITKQLNPTEAILAGSMVNGTLEFKAQKNIGVADGGCPMSSISITLFAEQIAVEWKESQQEGCMGGQMLMKRN